MQPPTPDNNLHHGDGPLFARGFVGSIGAHPAAIDIPTSFDGLLGKRCESSSAFHHVIFFGESQRTFKPESSIWNESIFKGRPHLLEKHSGEKARTTANLVSALPNLDNKFSLFAKVADTFVLATDLLGTGALFYAPRADHLYFSTHFGLLLQALDEDLAYDTFGLFSLVATKTFWDRRTVFKGCYRLQASECLVVDDPASGEIVVRKYADIIDLLTTSQTTYSDSECAEAINVHLGRSLLRECLPNDTALMLSGGKDSTALALALSRESIPLKTCITYGDRRTWDRRIALETALSLGFSHECVPYDSWTFETWASDIIELCGGLLGLQDPNLPGYDFARRNSSCAVVGFLGDAATGGHLPTASDPTPKDIFRAVIPRNILDAAVYEEFPDEVDELAQLMQNRFDGLSGVDDVRRAMLLDLTCRQASWISLAFDLYESRLPLVYPFYYRPFLQLMLSTPEHRLRNQAIYQSSIALGWQYVKASTKKTLRRAFRQRWHQIVHKIGDAFGIPTFGSKLDWEPRVKRSLGFLNEMAAGVDDPRMKRLCEQSIHNLAQLPQDQCVPLSLIGVVPSLARTRFRRRPILQHQSDEVSG